MQTIGIVVVAAITTSPLWIPIWRAARTAQRLEKGVQQVNAAVNNVAPGVAPLTQRVDTLATQVDVLNGKVDVLLSLLSSRPSKPVNPGDPP